MKTITMKKETLVEKILQNKNQHQEEYLEAMGICREHVSSELAKFSAGVRDKVKGDLKNNYYFEIPVSRVSDYDQALAMLDYEVGELVTLTSDEFENYIQDKWRWTENFKSINSSYISMKG